MMLYNQLHLSILEGQFCQDANGLRIAVCENFRDHYDYPTIEANFLRSR